MSLHSQSDLTTVNRPDSTKRRTETRAGPSPDHLAARLPTSSFREHLPGVSSIRYCVRIHILQLQDAKLAPLIEHITA